jgi:hypothetical protein
MLFFMFFKSLKTKRVSDYDKNQMTYIVSELPEEGRIRQKVETFHKLETFLFRSFAMNDFPLLPALQIPPT